MAAEAAPDRINAAWGAYFEGRGLTARQDLTALLGEPATQESWARLAVLGALLDICIRMQSDPCLAEHAPQYVDAAEAVAETDPQVRAQLARRAAYYFDHGRLALRRPEVTAQILDWAPWKVENAFDVPLYLQRQVLAAEVQVALDDARGATRSLDKVLSLIASVKNPQDGRYTVAWTGAEAVSLLIELGDSDRAYGVYAALGPMVAQTLPPLSVEAARFRLSEAQLLQERGDLPAAVRAAEAAAATLRVIELDPEERERLLGAALTLKAALCAIQGDPDCAGAALAEHPFAARHAKAGRAPASMAELTYLTARALAHALTGEADPVAAQALAKPAGFATTPATDALIEAYRALGHALAQPQGDGRASGLYETGRRMTAALAAQPAGGFGAWRRPDAIDRTIVALALTQAAAEQPDADETVFALLQLAGRMGATSESDALTALSQAKDALQRRSIHQALRLRARRDRLERLELRKVAERMSTAPTSQGLSHDHDTRSLFRDFAKRLSETDRRLSADGIEASGLNLVSLADFQASLGEDEAALSFTLVPGGVAQMCVRRDGVRRRVGPLDARRMLLDLRALQGSLTAGHAPSEDLDAQFPAEAAVRLYDLLIRPLDACLKPGDHVLWLPNAGLFPLPLGALLERVPPKLGDGYDLAAADWFARRHAISYPGAASVVAAIRSAPAGETGYFDFLGVGDPIFSGATPAGEDRAKVLLRGARLSALQPLPETRDELERSAAPFAAARVLLQGQATERAVRGELIGGYRHLSFATHGLIRDELEGVTEPALALTPVSAGDPADDGLLTASEIADLSLAARFVALSACNTANYDLSRMSGELSALASAFAVAGTPAVLGTLWPVESETGKEVVAGVFERLGGGEARPAQALADAQRAFLAAPPGRAYLHPRFWAPFLLLGDGGRGTAAAPAPAALSMEVLTRGTGGASEVLGLARSEAGIVARFIGAADAEGRHGAGIAAVSGERTWRREDRNAGAGNLIVPLGRSLLTSGYVAAGGDRFIPTLELFDAKTGRRTKAWRGDAAEGASAFVLGGAALGSDQAVFVTAERSFDPNRITPARLRAFEVDAKLAPRPLFEIALPAGVQVDEATIIPRGETLLLTYSRRHGASPPLPEELDDFEWPICIPPPTTWIEVRDGRTGALVARRELPGWAIAAGAAWRDGTALAGAFKADCATDEKAGLLTLGPDLAPEILNLDDSLGVSEIRALAVAPDGALIAAGRKENLLDYRLGDAPLSGGKRASYSGVVLTVGPDGTVSQPRMLDSGGNLFLFSVEASDPESVVLGGAVGGEAAVFRLDRGAFPPTR